MLFKFVVTGAIGMGTAQNKLSMEDGIFRRQRRFEVPIPIFVALL